MDSTIDLTSFLPDFLAEIQEHLDKLTQGLLELERRAVGSKRESRRSALNGEGAGADDVPLVRELFRSAHTIKGTARMIGYSAVAQIAHAAENVLDELRERRVQVSPGVVDTLLEAVDAIKDLLASDGPQPESAPPELLRRLEGVKSSGQESTAREQQTAMERDPAPGFSPVERVERPAEEGDRATRHAPRATPPAGGLDDTIRVSVARLDALLKQIADLTALKTEWETGLLELRELTQLAGEQRKFSEGALSMAESLPTSPASARITAQLLRLRDREDRLLTDLKTVSGMTADRLETLSHINDRLHDDVIGLRLLPLATILSPLARTVRDLAREEGKQIEVTVMGGEVELDRRILQEMSEPLLHIVRNAVSHGIELPENRTTLGKPAAGRISLRATRQGDRALIEIADDGRGLDPQTVRQVAVGRGVISAEQAAALDDRAALELIYAAGFSTSPFITESSGRGVGMSAVKTAVHGLGGTVYITGRPGAGTTFTLSLPLAFSMIHVLLVAAGGQTYALPAASVQALRIVAGEWAVGSEQAERLPTRIDLDGQAVALAALAEVLGLSSLRSFSLSPSPRHGRGESWRNAVLVHSGQSRAIVKVDALVDERRVTIKSVGRLLRRSCEFISGATVLADGAVAFLLDPASLISVVERRAWSAERSQAQSTLDTPRSTRILVVDDMATTRELERSILTAAGYDVEVASDGAQALERLREAAFDLVVTDIEMPVMDGMALTAAIRRQRRLAHLPVIIVTSLDKHKAERHGREAGAQAYIEKSMFTQNILLDTIERLVNGRK